VGILWGADDVPTVCYLPWAMIHDKTPYEQVVTDRADLDSLAEGTKLRLTPIPRSAEHKCRPHHGERISSFTGRTPRRALQAPAATPPGACLSRSDRING
jgi:hypothetical protein